MHTLAVVFEWGASLPVDPWRFFLGPIQFSGHCSARAIVVCGQHLFEPVLATVSVIVCWSVSCFLIVTHLVLTETPVVYKSGEECNC